MVEMVLVIARFLIRKATAQILSRLIFIDMRFFSTNYLRSGYKETDSYAVIRYSWISVHDLLQTRHSSFY